MDKKKEKSTGPEDIELRSDRVNDILTAIPSWTIRWGSFSILVILIFIVGTSYFIKYPDIVVSRFKLNTESLPIVIKPKIRGRLNRLLVDDKSEVKEGDVLIVLESTVDFAHMQTAIEDYQKFLPFIRKHKLDSVHFNRYLKLGSVQDSYSQLLTIIDEARLYNVYNLGGQLPNNLKKELELIKKVREKQIANLVFKSRSLQLGKLSCLRDSVLHHQGVISDFDFEKSRDMLLRNEMEKNAQELRLLEIDLQIEKLKQAISSGVMDSLKSIHGLHLKLFNAQLQFEEAINQWNDTYLLMSPIAGTANFSRPLEEGEIISSEDGVLTINPSKGKLIAYTLLPAAGSGKVKPGQRVMLRFDGFPHNEYGTVSGLIENISSVSIESGYYVRIDLPDELITNFGKSVGFTQNMSGEAHIVTEDTRLLERVFYQFRALLLN